MARLDRELERTYMDAALAEGREFPTFQEDLEAAVRTMECSFVDVTYAESGEFTASACLPKTRETGRAANQPGA